MAANKSIIEDGIVGEAIDRAVGEYGGNFGSTMLAKNAEKLKAALAQIKLDKDDGTAI